MKNNIARAILVNAIITLSFLSYPHFYFRTNFIGNYYSQKDNSLRFSFNNDYSGIYVDEANKRRYPFNWRFAKADKDSKVFLFTPSPPSYDYDANLPLVVSGKERKKIPVSWVVTITTGKNLMTTYKRSRKFNDDNLFAMDMRTDHNDQQVLTYYETKKSLWLDIKNYINHE